MEGGGGGYVGITPVHLSGFCQDDIITQPFVTKLGMVVHHHGLECHEAITGLEFSRSRSARAHVIKNMSTKASKLEIFFFQFDD